jgi:glycosyltransferase involved in cell wall biosynthesis
MPYPDGRQTPAERKYWQRRGPLGLHFQTNYSQSSVLKSLRELARAAWRAGYDVSVNATGPETGWPRTSIRRLEGLVKSPYACVSWSRNFRAPEHQTRIEFDCIDSFAWAQERDVRFINDRVDLLCVLSPECESAYRKAGVTVPIKQVMLGYDPVVYQRWPRDERLIERITWFGSGRQHEKLILTGGFLQPRKGLAECIEAFKLAYDQGLEASLVVYSNSDHHGTDVADLVMREGEKYPIGFMPGGLSDWAMARLYSTVDLFVSCHRMEGFGLMPLEALACGTPVVATNYGGPKQYLDASRVGTVEPLVIRMEDLDVPGLHCEYAVIDLRAAALAMTLEIDDNRPVADVSEWAWGSGWLNWLYLWHVRGAANAGPPSVFEMQPPPDDGSWSIPELEDILPHGPGMAASPSAAMSSYGFSPTGLGSLDLALETISHGGCLRDVGEKGLSSLPPWWLSATSQSDAEERLQSHLDQLDFWWADLLEHIRATGWWPKCVQ